MTTPDKRSKNGRRAHRRKRVLGAGEPSAIDVIDESIHLLRRLRLEAWVVYGLGVSVFTFSILFFWIEMSGTRSIETSLLPGALLCGVALLIFKVCQARMLSMLQDQHQGLSGSRWSIQEWGVCLRRQCTWTGLAIWTLPIVFVVTVPFARVFAFFQSILCMGARKLEDVDLREEWTSARIWPEQNWTLLTLLSVAWVCIFVNLLSLVFFVPYLLDALLGFETEFSRAGIYMFNSITLFVCSLLAFLITDPVVKAAYYLRRHYAVSQATGEDLLLRVQQGTSKVRAGHSISAAALSIVFLCIGLPAESYAQSEKTGETSVPSERIQRLEESLQETLERREFAWRFPREEFGDFKSAEEKPSLLASLMDWMDRMSERLQRMLDEWFRGSERAPPPEGLLDGSSGVFDLLLMICILALVLTVVFFVAKTWRQNKALEDVALADGDLEETVVNLESDEVSADQLPRNEWVELAQSLISKGELRLALRAYFLAQLAALSAEGIIIVKRGKSNREYAYEVAKRAHAQEGVDRLYRSGMLLYEGVWYGNHQAGSEEIGQMESVLKKQGVLS